MKAAYLVLSSYLPFLQERLNAVDLQRVRWPPFSREDKMKKIVTSILLGLLLPLSVCAGQIYGSIKEGGRPVPAKVRFEAICRDQTYVGETDGYGAYSINIGKGRCTLKVYYQGQTPTFDLYAYDNAVRYNFELERQGNGQYLLRRK
jgi:hypothetical protein